MQTLGELLQKAEERHGVGRGRAAVMCGANRSTYRAWKGGSQTPRLEHVPGIIRFTGESPEVILSLLGLTKEDIEALLAGRAMGVLLSSTLVKSAA